MFTQHREKERGRGRRQFLRLLSSLLVACPWLACQAQNGTADVFKGESAGSVTNELGKPAGMMQLGHRMVYLYDRGMIDFEDAKVTRSDLVTEELAKRMKLERERAEAESRRHAEQEQQRLKKEGQAERQRMTTDAIFTQLPPAERLERWKGFAQKYPYTPVQDEIARVASELEAQQSTQDRDRQLVRLITRLKEIKARFKQLDADYAASLANWKRNEIDAERATLIQEYTILQTRIAKEP